MSFLNVLTFPMCLKFIYLTSKINSKDMKTILSPKFAAFTLFYFFSAAICFHFCILFGLIPFEIVWGGRLKSLEEMVVFETISLTINFLMLFVVSVRCGILKIKLHDRVFPIFFWFIFVLFALNTVGNLFSTNDMERLIFTPITAISALLSLRLALSKE